MKPNFQKNQGDQAKIRKIHVVHKLSTCTFFSILESENMTGLALVLISFNILKNNFLDEDLENIVTVRARKLRRITV